MNTTGFDPQDPRSGTPSVLQGKNTDRATLATIARRAMVERNLEPDFPPAALQELATIGGPADATGDVRDMRERLWVSIDNDDSLDLDQLTVAELLVGGRVRILVAVADVDALVRKDSAIDGHAALNTTSVYTPAVIFPMLPEALSTNLTSLNEDFMIAANGVAATYLEAKGFPSLRRVLRSPERWDRIVQLASGFGDRLPTEPDAVALEAFLGQRRKADPEKFADLSLAVVKLIGRGEYALDPSGGESPGHFGLAVKDYTHSTAPNRRFPDLITQRLLKAAMAGAPLPYAIPELAELAKHCTEQEDNATKVERRVRKSAAALLLSGRIGEQFEAIVTGASPKGTWVRLLRPPAEGRLESGFQGLDVGDHVHVKLVRTDAERGFIDFARA